MNETDEEFWERMQREHPGQQSSDPHLNSPDMAGQSFDELGYDDDDLDDPPTNTSTAEHHHLLRGGFQWDRDDEHPRYAKQDWREITDADGRPSYDQEGHVIERNTRVIQPQFDEDADPLKHPWTHTYYPAGVGDDWGLVGGHNTAQQAARAATQLGVWGARHPDSQALLKGYRYVGGAEGPYDPSVELPHETAMGGRS